MKKIEQWNLPRNAKVKSEDTYITFLGMDGAYARWLKEDGEVAIGNFWGFKVNKDGHYETIEKPKDYKNPKRWTTDKVINKVEGLKAKIKKTPRLSDDWFNLQLDREIAQIKKHVILYEQLRDKQKNANTSNINNNNIHMDRK